MKELVSVVIPAFNREKTIVRAIHSVLNQTYPLVEVIIVDDCSSDCTQETILNSFANDSRVIYYKLNKNSGACVARNVGVKLSKGKFVAFLDSDDSFIPDKIEKQVNLLKKTNSLLCATDFTYIQSNGEEKYVKSFTGKETIYENLLYCNFITTGTLLGYKDCFVDIPFDESLPRYQDWDLVLRLCKKYSFCFLNESTLLQYYQPISITASTNNDKTFVALMTIYGKNIDGYKLNSKAYSQIHWLIGLHSLFVPNQKKLRSLWKGVVGNGFNFRRLMIYFAAVLNLKGFIRNKI